jgi:hypothetical protein
MGQNRFAWKEKVLTAIGPLSVLSQLNTKYTKKRTDNDNFTVGDTGPVKQLQI